jgi:tight adherence protein C
MLSLILLFAGLGLAALSVYLFSQVVLSNNTDTDALAWASGNEPVVSKSPFINFSRKLVHNFALQHARRIKNEGYRKSVEKKILTSGLSRELNVDEFIGLQILWGALFPVALLIINFALGMGLPLPLVIGLGFVGALFPHFYCNQQKSERYTSVIIELPFYIDLLALSTEAGLDFVNAIQRLVDKTGKSVLADELGIVLKDIRLGRSRADAFRDLATRLDIPEITSFTSMIIDSDATGTSIAQVLKDQSIQMRLERFVRAEKAGARASQTILIPMMVFILPAVFIVVFAPVILQFYYGGSN